MTESEVKKALEDNNWKLVKLAMILSVSTPGFGEDIITRAKVVKEKLKEEEQRLEALGREIEIRKRIDQLEQLEMELGIYR